MSGVLQGTEFVPVTVEVTASKSEASRFVIVGLADTAIREAKERVLAALFSIGAKLPNNITVNLAPAEVKKEGTGFDLPIALAVLSASGLIKPPPLSLAVFGELSLDGKIRPVSGALALSLGAERLNFEGIILPSGNSGDLIKREKFSFFGTDSLAQLVKALSADLDLRLEIKGGSENKRRLRPFSGIIGQKSVKRALTLAVAGGHHLLMVGPPGCGKSLLASRVPHILPPLTEEEQYEVLFLKSLARDKSEISVLPPFRAPHHTVSEAGLIGGGSPPKPGEVTLAHRGVLFLDEFPEFKRGVLESLRAPLETGYVEISRVKGKERYPAKFQLIAAMNPCPCGYMGDPRCTCSRTSIQKYLSKVSGPMLDRFDIQINVEKVDPFNNPSNSDDEIVIEKILTVREKQKARFGVLNASLPAKEALSILSKEPQISRILEKANLTMRGLVRVLRVARTIADWEDSETIRDTHVLEGLSFRNLDKLIDSVR
jgi:magnesium chelatase family protein